MSSKTTNKFSPEVRDRVVRMVFDHERDHLSRWATVVSIAEKIGCVPQTLRGWVEKAEVNSGNRTGVPTAVADKVKALKREVCELGQIVVAAVADNHPLLQLIANIPTAEAEDQYYAAAANIYMAA